MLVDFPFIQFLDPLLGWAFPFLSHNIYQKSVQSVNSSKSSVLFTCQFITFQEFLYLHFIDVLYFNLYLCDK